MYPVIHNDPYRYGVYLPIQHFTTLENAINYAKQEKNCKVYDYNFKRYYDF